VRKRLPDEEHLGLLGPLIRAEVGDTIQVVFRNNLTFPVNLEPSGVLYSDADVQPVPANTTTTIRWTVPEQVCIWLSKICNKKTA
jgi:manganese oxidase